jgi:hypothetical protein
MLGGAVVGSAVAVFGPLLRKVSAFKVHGSRDRVEFTVDKKTLWVVDISKFGGNPVLELVDAPTQIVLRLKNARFPGTDLSADFEALIHRTHGSSRLHLKFGFGAYGEVGFEEWLTGTLPWTARIYKPLTMRVMPMGGYMATKPGTRILFYPNWTLELSGNDTVAFIGTEVTAKGDNVRIILDEPFDDARAIPATAKTTAVRARLTSGTLALNEVLHPIELSCDSLESSIVALHVAENDNSERYRSMTLHGATCGTLTPDLRIASGCAQTKIAFHGFRYATAEVPGKSEWAFVGDLPLRRQVLGGEPILFAIVGRRGESGQIEISGFGRLKRSAVLRAVLDEMRPRFQGAYLAPFTFDEGEQGEFLLARSDAPGVGPRFSDCALFNLCSQNGFVPIPHEQVFRITRKEDHLVLGFAFSNAMFRMKHGKVVLAQRNKKTPWLMRVSFPPQAIAEEAFFEAVPAIATKFPISKEDYCDKNGFDKTVLDPNNQTECDRRFAAEVGPLGRDPDINKTSADNETVTDRSHVRFAGESRLVFVLPNRDLDFEANALLGWDELPMKLTARAYSSESLVLKQHKGECPECQVAERGLPILPPGPEETAIEAPYRLFLSPDEKGRWTNAARLNRGNAVHELWHAELSTERQLSSRKNARNPIGPGERPRFRAVWSPDHVDGTLPNHSSNKPFRMALDQRDRHEIVELTSRFYARALKGARLPDGQPSVRDLGEGESCIPPPGGKHEDCGIYVPQAIPSEAFRLTSLGAWIRSRGTWEPPVLYEKRDDASIERAALTVEEWRHISTLGRSHFDRVVYKGFLFPLGIRASLVKVTERTFRINSNRQVVAVPVQRMFIVIGKPTKTYPAAVGQPDAGRGFPFKQIKLSRTVTPDILDPEQINSVNSPFALPTDIFPNQGDLQAAFWVVVPKGAQVAPAARIRQTPSSGELYQFAFEYDDNKGAGYVPMIFVDNTVVHYSRSIRCDQGANGCSISASNIDPGDCIAIATTDPACAPSQGMQYQYVALKRLIRYYNSEIAKTSDFDDYVARRATLSGNKVEYATPNADGNTEFETEEMRLEARFVSPPELFGSALLETENQPAFYPVLNTAKARIPAVERLAPSGGVGNTRTGLQLDEVYLATGFSPDANKGEVFAKVVSWDAVVLGNPKPQPVNLNFTGQGNRSGGVCTPNITVTGLSRKVGLVGGSGAPASGSQAKVSALLTGKSTPELNTFRDGQFDPLSFFGADGRFLGLVSLRDLLRIALAEKAPKLLEQVESQLASIGEDIAKALKDFAESIDLTRLFQEIENTIKDMPKTPWYASVRASLDRLLQDIADAKSCDIASRRCVRKDGAGTVVMDRSPEQVFSSIVDRGRELQRLFDSARSDPTQLIPSENVQTILELIGKIEKGPEKLLRDIKVVFKEFQANARKLVRTLESSLGTELGEREQWVIEIYSKLDSKLTRFEKTLTESLESDLSHLFADLFELAKALGAIESTYNKRFDDAVKALSSDRATVELVLGQIGTALEESEKNLPRLIGAKFHDLDQLVLRKAAAIVSQCEPHRAAIVHAMEEIGKALSNSIMQRVSERISRINAELIRIAEALEALASIVPLIPKSGQTSTIVSDFVQRAPAAVASLFDGNQGFKNILAPKFWDYLQKAVCAPAQPCDQAKVFLNEQLGKVKAGLENTARLVVEAAAAPVPPTTPLEQFADKMRQAQTELRDVFESVVNVALIVDVVEAAAIGASSVAVRVYALQTNWTAELAALEGRRDDLVKDLGKGCLTVVQFIDGVINGGSGYIASKWLVHARDLREGFQSVASNSTWANVVMQIDATKPGIARAVNLFLADVGDLVRQPSIDKLINIDSILKKVLSAFIPTKVTLNYDFSTELHDFGPFKPQPKKDRPTNDHLLLQMRLVVDLLAGKQSMVLHGEIWEFNIDLGFIRIPFASVKFEATDGLSPSLKVVLDEVALSGQLSFLQALQKQFNPKTGPFLLLTTTGVRTGFRFSLPAIDGGAFTIADFLLVTEVNLPFTNVPATIGISISDRSNPFKVIAGVMGGAGFFGMRMIADRLESMEASFEYGAMVEKNYSVLTASGRVSVGVYFQQSAGQAVLTGFFFAGGHATVAGVDIGSVSLRVEITCTVYLADHYYVVDGKAEFSFSITIGWFSVDYSVEVHEQLAKNTIPVSEQAAASELNVILLNSAPRPKRLLENDNIGDLRNRSVAATESSLLTREGWEAYTEAFAA